MTIAEILGALEEHQTFDIRTKDGDRIDYATASKHDVRVIGVSAVDKNIIRIDTNFSWYC